MVDFNRLAILFGRYFQIRDDYLNISSQKVSKSVVIVTPYYVVKIGI